MLSKLLLIIFLELWDAMIDFALDLQCFLLHSKIKEKVWDCSYREDLNNYIKE